LLSISSHPSILNITSAIITSQKILNCTQYRDNNNTKGNDEKTEKTGKPVSPQQNLVQEPEGNEENKYSDPDSNKMKINYAKEPNEAHKNNLKEDILQVLNENFIEMILGMVNQNVQETLKKCQDNKNREFEKAKEEIKETTEALYKHQSETKNMINKEINELRTKIDNIKEAMTQDMENLRKKNETELQNKTEGQSSRIEQTEERISELEDEMVIKGKTEELLVKQLKTCEKKMQEFTDSIKRPNLRIMGIEEGEEVQAKEMHNIFNKIITENFPNLEKAVPIQMQEASRTPNRPDQNRSSPQHIIIKTTSSETRERILKAVREKKNNIQR
jgi:chromosome segregation ATPase